MDFTGYYKDYCSNFASTPTTSALHRIGARLPEEMLGRILSFIHRGDYIGKEEKHPVGQLALTCRYWAIECQPAIFKWIELRSGKDLEELLSLMASPLSRVASYIKKLRLYQRVAQDPPWLHLVALRLVPELSLEWPTFLQLSNAIDIRSIHDGLPRSYSSFSSHISHLYLSNVDDIDGQVDDIDGQVDDIDGQVDDIDGQVDDIVYNRLYNFYFILPSLTGPNSIIEFEIVGIYIVEYEDGDSDMWKKTCEQLPPLQKLVLGFKSRENMARFVREVVKTNLDNLSSADRVKFAILQGHEWNGMWLRASVDSEELKANPTREGGLAMMVIMQLELCYIFWAKE
ncbi:hypothetical protein PHLCEN_2v7388 [Hermanssonia centrifuga]|uniref:F-box domain-containing protein n=1 Tax=Hermanssonia centrifuga TaxID=98765 RepID=A0A2R6NWM6_9APHY|nr:hypothetical protein PHLCEN_2v7388 [Hermanssonia centrifuga]